MNRNRNEICTIGLISVNIAVFFILSIFGRTEDPVFMMDHGAMFIPFITQKQEYYRLFTCMFLHFGIDHLLNNMVMLGAIGWNLESHLGHLRFLIIYLLSGLGGNLLSFFINLHGDQNVVSAGASGAVFGMMGALVLVVIRHHGRLQTLTKRRLLIMVFLSLYCGFTSAGVDNAAHVGGLLCGFISAWILYRKPKEDYSSFL